jgi:hypothetical protein
MNPLIQRLVAIARIFITLIVIGCGVVYIYVRWIVHNPDAALSLTIIAAIAGLVVMAVALLNAYFDRK